jgi:WD40 repeat protein
MSKLNWQHYKDALNDGELGKQILAEVVKTEKGSILWQAYNLLYQTITKSERNYYLPFTDKVFNPDEIEPEMLDTQGHGHIYNLFPINEDLVIVCTTGGASLLDINRQVILWEIFCLSSISAVSADYTLIALSDGKNTYIWDLRIGKVIYKFLEEQNRIYQLAFSPDGELLALVSKEGVIWREINSGQEIHSIEFTNKNILVIAFSSDSKIFACGSNYNNISLWDIKSKTKIKTSLYNQESFFNAIDKITFLQYEMFPCISTMAFCFDNSSLITTASFSTQEKPSSSWQDICFWDVASLKLVKTIATWIETTNIVLNNHLNLLVGGNFDYYPLYGYRGRIEIWDLDSDAVIESHRIVGYNPTFVPDSNFLVSAIKDGTVRVWDLSSKSEEKLKNLAFIRNVSFKFALLLLLEDFLVGTLFLNQYRVQAYRYSQSITSITTTITFSPDSNLLASGSYDGTIKLWGVINTTKTKDLIGHNGGICSLVFSPNGKLIASASRDRTIRLWDVISGKVIHIINTLPDTPQWTEYSKDNRIYYYDRNGHLQSNYTIQLDISPDNKLLASVNSLETVIKIWDLNSGQLIKTLEQKNVMSSLAFSPDNKLLAAGGENGFTLWDVASGQLHSQQPNLNNSRKLKQDCIVNSLKFNLDSQLLLVGYNNHILQLWNVETGRKIRQFEQDKTKRWGVKYERWNGKNLIFDRYDKIMAVDRIGEKIRLWELISGKQIGEIKQQIVNSYSSFQVAFSCDYQILAICSEDIIYFWSVEDLLWHYRINLNGKYY